MALVILSFILILLSSTASACDHCLHRSKATYTHISSGSCGYGSLADGGHLAAGLPFLFKQGAGCGACFKVRCTNRALCKKEGTRVVLTERHGDNRTDLVLDQSVFTAMANKGASQSLLNQGIVDIEYKRVPCYYGYKNLALRVENYSSRPYYLAVLILYQGGQTEIVAVDIAQVSSRNWTSMKRNYGAVWDTNKVPSGPLKFRFLVISGNRLRYIETPKVLPSEWKSGVIYDAGVQIKDIAQENCHPYPCDQSTW